LSRWNSQAHSRYVRHLESANESPFVVLTIPRERRSKVRPTSGKPHPATGPTHPPVPGVPAAGPGGDPPPARRLTQSRHRRGAAAAHAGRSGLPDDRRACGEQGRLHERSHRDGGRRLAFGVPRTDCQSNALTRQLRGPHLRPRKGVPGGGPFSFGAGNECRTGLASMPSFALVLVA